MLYLFSSGVELQTLLPLSYIYPVQHLSYHQHKEAIEAVSLLKKYLAQKNLSEMEKGEGEVMQP